MPIRRPDHGCHGYSSSRNSVLWAFSSLVVQHDQAPRLNRIQATSTRGIRARIRRAAGCATPTGSAGHAGATANLKLTFHLDHSAGADHTALRGELSPYRGLPTRLARVLRKHHGKQRACSLPPACCACLPGRDWKACVDLREPRVSLDVLALGDDAIAKRDIARAALQFAHLEARAALPHIEPLAVALRREEHTILVELHHLGEIGIELHRGAAAR